MGSGGSQTQTTQNIQNPQVGYWTNRTLQAAGPYYLSHLTMPPDLKAMVANLTPDQLAAIGSIEGLSSPASGIAGAGASFLENMLAIGTDPAAGIRRGGPALANILDTLGLGDTTGMLADTIAGKYLDPATNPWLKGTYDEAARGVTDQYELSTAPSLMAEGEIASGGGPGAFANNSAANQAQWAERYGLGQNLGNLATNIYGGAYQQERQNQLAATGQAESLAGEAANIGQSSVAQQLQALGLLPQTQSSLYEPANQLLGAGTLQQQQQQNVLDTLFQNAMRQANWPEMMFSNFGALLNQLGSGSGTQITTGTGGGAMK